MALPRPESLQELADEQQVHLVDLHVQCGFCDRLLTFLEKILFESQDLGVIWRGQTPRGVCQACLFICARNEYYTFFEGDIPAETVEEVGGLPLGDLRVRCWKCYTPLTNSEKLEHIVIEEPFKRVAGKIRGQCMVCRATSNPLGV